MQYCGICKRAPRPGEDHMKIRLAEEDMVDKKYPAPKLPGLYQCCTECHAEYLPIVAERLGHTVESCPQNHVI